MASVKRNFYYYDIAESDPSFTDIIEAVTSLDADKQGMFTQNQQQFLINVSDRADDIWAGTATLLREDARPELGKRNSTEGTAIDMAGNDGILERSHFIYSLSHKVLMFEWNSYGPRATAFFRGLDYLYQKFVDEDSSHINWSYVPKQGSLQKIRQGKAIASINFSTKPTRFGGIQQTDSTVGGLLNDVRSLGRAKKAGFYLQGDKKNPLMSISEFMRQIINGFNIPETYEKLEVKVINQNNLIDTVDLVKDYVHSSMRFITVDDTKVINTTEAHIKMKEELRKLYGES